MAGKKAPLALSHIESRILHIRGHKVLLDSDLAALYGVETGRLNEQVRRNAKRFPKDFIFSLDNQETANLRSQIAISSSNRAHGGRRYSPVVFTEHGAIMAAMVQNSPRAVEVSVFVVRAFVKLRELSQAHQEIGKKLDDLEKRVSGHDERRPIGFAPWDEQ